MGIEAGDDQISLPSTEVTEPDAIDATANAGVGALLDDAATRVVLLKYIVVTS